jgi:hypothetical protein
MNHFMNFFLHFQKKREGPTEARQVLSQNASRWNRQHKRERRREHQVENRPTQRETPGPQVG